MKGQTVAIGIVSIWIVAKCIVLIGEVDGGFEQLRGAIFPKSGRIINPERIFNEKRNANRIGNIHNIVDPVRVGHGHRVKTTWRYATVGMSATILIHFDVFTNGYTIWRAVLNRSIKALQRIDGAIAPIDRQGWPVFGCTFFCIGYNCCLIRQERYLAEIDLPGPVVSSLCNKSNR